jgi:(2Fe-2S) ferredoxin
MKYEKHIFICTNEKDGKKCCGEKTGMELVNSFKTLINTQGIHKQVRAQRAGCFDVCAQGPAVVVYPEGVFYGCVTPADVKEIFEEHILNNRPVERLKLDF